VNTFIEELHMTQEDNPAERHTQECQSSTPIPACIRSVRAQFCRPGDKDKDRDTQQINDNDTDSADEDTQTVAAEINLSVQGIHQLRYSESAEDCIGCPRICSSHNIDTQDSQTQCQPTLNVHLFAVLMVIGDKFICARDPPAKIF
jgi:hypothetical protein